ncbi:MAG: AAA family ATPase [Planctomycetales bacterium]|nr:AAA family ATPase [Planctomycetales bacterium]
MRIDHLQLANFRCFSDKTFSFGSTFNLIVGENGQGKTAVLEGLALAAGRILHHFPLQGVGLITDEQVRRVFHTSGQTLTVEPQFPVVIKATGAISGEEGLWTIQRKSGQATDNSKAGWLHLRSQELQKQVQDASANSLLPVISYYGTERLWLQTNGRTAINTLGPDSRFAGYHECLNTASSHPRLLEWFKTQELIALQRSATIPVLEACRQAIVRCVPGATRVYFDVAYDQLILMFGDKGVPFDYLSDGYRNILAMVADLAVKCATLNPHLEANASAESVGIVLIDEIDLHLHPKWHRRVISDLVATFPQLQFVATTHSPFVIQSLPLLAGVQLINLDDPSNRDVSNKSIEDIAEQIQGISLPQRSQRHVDLMQQAAKYFEMLDRGSKASADEKELARTELEKLALPYSDDPAYHALIKMKQLATQKNGENGTAGATQ